ncbi:MAG: ATP-binding protein [Bryobacteraceae bacterium]
MNARIFAKLTVSFMCLLIIAMTAVDFFAGRIAESNYIENLTRELNEKGRMIAVAERDDLQRLAADGSDARMVARIQALAREADARLTVIARDGRVLADSEADAALMENHANRPEVVSAIGGDWSSGIRLSPTMGVKFLYVAVPLPAGALRLAVPLSEIQQQVDGVRMKMLGATAVAFLPAIALAAFFARRISRRLASVIDYAGQLAKGNFRERLSGVDKGELGLLSKQLNDTAAHLQKAVEQLEREHAELEKLERVRKDFVINVSHELRTPLASIQGYTETLMDGALEDPRNNMRFLGIIRHNAERLARLTADLMTLSRIELKTQEFQFAVYRINESLESGLDTMRPIADKKNIHLKLAAETDVAVYCDSEALHQILSNLLDNAIKYTPVNGSITVGTGPIDDGRIEIFVQDTGIGIPPEDVPRLFERFYRVDKARSRELGGTGLGLSIVKHLVRAHGGEIQVRSESGRGSCFYFTLQVEPSGRPLEGEAVEMPA